MLCVWSNCCEGYAMDFPFPHVPQPLPGNPVTPTPLELLQRFADFGATLPISLPDRAPFGLGALTAEDFRNALKVYREDLDCPERVTEALQPFARAGKGIPEKAREWKFGTSPLTYGDFIRASELYS